MGTNVGALAAGDQTCIAWYDAAHTRCSATAQN
jgi:hypothetical protein